MPPVKRKIGDNKLDALLRQGAANKKVDINKAIINSNDRLLKEKIIFTKSPDAFDSVKEFKNVKFIVLDSSKEADARKKMDRILEKKNTPLREMSRKAKKQKKNKKVR